MPFKRCQTQTNMSIQCQSTNSLSISDQFIANQISRQRTSILTQHANPSPTGADKFPKPLPIYQSNSFPCHSMVNPYGQCMMELAIQDKLANRLSIRYHTTRIDHQTHILAQYVKPLQIECQSSPIYSQSIRTLRKELMELALYRSN